MPTLRASIKRLKLPSARWSWLKNNATLKLLKGSSAKCHSTGMASPIALIELLPDQVFKNEFYCSARR